MSKTLNALVHAWLTGFLASFLAGCLAGCMAPLDLLWLDMQLLAHALSVLVMT